MAPVINQPLLDREHEKLLMQQLASVDTTHSSAPELAGRELAMNTVVNANLRLVASIARRYTGKGLAWHDLMQEGTMGLIVAANRFEPDRGYRFSTYATYWIRHRCQRAVYDSATLIRIPVYTQQRIHAIRRAQAATFYATGRRCTVDELGSELQLSALKISRAMEAERCLAPVSLDAPLRSSRPGHPSDLKSVIDGDAHEDDALNVEALREKLQDVLTEHEHAVVSLHYGLDGDRPMSMAKIGAELDLSAFRVRSMHQRALRKLKQAISKQDMWT